MTMRNLKEFSFAIARIILGVVVLLEGLIVLDLIIHIGVTGSTVTDKVVAAYDVAYDQAFVQNYDVAYQGSYDEAFVRGYDKGHEIGLRDGYNAPMAARVELRNPTHKELRRFLESDKTDSNPYISNEYVCFEFATQVNNNAEANGLRAAYVRLRFENWAHAVVAFETADRGLVFIEPQSDREVKLVAGKPYPWLTSGAIRTTKYGDAIIEMQVIW